MDKIRQQQLNTKNKSSFKLRVKIEVDKLVAEPEKAKKFMT